MRGSLARFLCLLATLMFWPSPVGALELAGRRVQVFGYGETRLRGLSDGFRVDGAHVSQWANILNVEAEFDFAPNGFGPVAMLQGFVRYELRFDCVWSSTCGLLPGMHYYGDEANRGLPHFSDGRTSGFAGGTRTSPSRRVLGDGDRLVDIRDFPLFGDLFDELGGDKVESTLRPVLEHRFSLRHFQGSRGPLTFPIGPLHPGDEIDAIGALLGRSSFTRGLELRPATNDLYTPSAALRSRSNRFGSFDQNFTEKELAWNRGASQQQTKELKEAYLDIELLDGALFFRLGKQTIVWGKTELFGNMDQFNPQDFSLATLASLEESRVGLWSARMIYSIYSLGAFEDFRFELAANLQPVEPADLGRCGEAYTPFLVCAKSAGLFAHGALGMGLAGEERPPKPWESFKGVEVGARIEFRYRDFSFAITDFYGYEDFPTVDAFYGFERNVDPTSGRPRVASSSALCTTGSEAECLTAGNALRKSSGNRQLFDVLCALTEGPDLGGLVSLYSPGSTPDDDCILDIFNAVGDVGPLGLQISELTSGALGSSGGATNVWSGAAYTQVEGALGIAGGSFPRFIELDREPTDNNWGGGAGTHGGNPRGLSRYLSDQQEALLGCGPFFFDESLYDDATGSIGTVYTTGGSCSIAGIDFFHAEASVLIQTFPGFSGGIATRVHQGQLIQLPGARSPFKYFSQPEGFRYDPEVDGCVGEITELGYSVAEKAIIDPDGICNDMAGTPLTNPDTNEIFRSELEALSYNFRQLLAGFSLGTDTDCNPSRPMTCYLVVAMLQAVGVTRPTKFSAGEGRFDFVWHGGSELALFYNRRNVLGFAMDFTEKHTKTSWGIELTWMNKSAYVNTREPRGYSLEDTFNLTISVDRPTFVRFINPTGTLFINSQWFIRYIPSHERGSTFSVDGPISALGTLTVFTGYYQDRLLPILTLVYDVTSRSGGEIFELRYRFNDRFSATVGVSSFFGKPRRARIPIRQAVLTNHGNDFKERTNYQGLSMVSEREELTLSLRYTF